MLAILNKPLLTMVYVNEKTQDVGWLPGEPTTCLEDWTTQSHLLNSRLQGEERAGG